MFYINPKWISNLALFIGLASSTTYAANIDHIRHVIFNDSPTGAYYEIMGIENSFCQAKGYLSPGEMKVLSCQSPTVSSYGPYMLQVTPPGWWGAAMRDSKIYNLTQNAQLTWRLAYVLSDRGNILGITMTEDPI